jgi:hypothetical protein
MPEATGGAAAAPDPVLHELAVLVARAEREGQAVLPELRAFLDKHPDAGRRLGDLAESAKQALIDHAVGGHVALKETNLRRARQLEAELAGPDASPLEQVLAENVAVAWLAVNEAELTALHSRSGPLPRADFLDRRRARARKRLESAARTLALV